MVWSSVVWRCNIDCARVERLKDGISGCERGRRASAENKIQHDWLSLNWIVLVGKLEERQMSERNVDWVKNTQENVISTNWHWSGSLVLQRFQNVSSCIHRPLLNADGIWAFTVIQCVEITVSFLSLPVGEEYCQPYSWLL